MKALDILVKKGDKAIDILNEEGGKTSSLSLLSSPILLFPLFSPKIYKQKYKRFRHKIPFLPGIRRRFELEGNWIFNGVYHFDGVFEGSARYRATFREDWWILKKDGEWTGEFEYI